MEQLQGSLRSRLQGDTKILKNLEGQRICSKHTRHKRQCSTFHRDAAGPHPGAGESCNGYTSRQNIGCAAHKDNIRAINPIHYPHRETCESTIRERRAEKSGHRSTPAEQGHRASRNSILSDPNSNQDQNMYSKSGKKIDPNGYCSSHGYKVEEAHMSATCRFPKNGHNKLAMRLDIKRGQILNK